MMLRRFPTATALAAIIVSVPASATLFLGGNVAATPGYAALPRQFTRVGPVQPYPDPANTAQPLRRGIIDTAVLTEVAYAGVVPEPASWAMLIAGIGFTGAAMRRRRYTPPSVAA